MENKSAIEQMKEYIRESRRKGLGLFKFLPSDEGDLRYELDEVCIDVIGDPKFTEKDGNVVKFPPFVSWVEFGAWNYSDLLEDCKVYIPKGCKIEFYRNRKECPSEKYFGQWIREIIVDEDHEMYSCEDGVLFNKDKTILLSYPSYKRNKEYRIPDSVVQIEKGAFFEPGHLEELYISKHVIDIGKCQFYSWLAVEVDSENTRYKSIGGSLYSKDGKIAYHLSDDGVYGNEKIKIEQGTFVVKNVSLRGGFYEVYVPDTLKLTEGIISAIDNVKGGFRKIKVPFELKKFFEKYENKYEVIYYYRVKEMKEYMAKCKENSREFFEFSYNEDDDSVCIDKIKEVDYDEDGHPIVKIPSFVCDIKANPNCDINKNCIFYISKGSTISHDCINCDGYYDEDYYFNTYIRDQYEFMDDIDCDVEREYYHIFPDYKDYASWAKVACRIVVEEEHENYLSEDGVLFDKDKTTLLAYPGYKTEEEYVIPDSVFIIDSDSFPKNSFLKTLFISKNVIQIKNTSFDSKVKIEVDPENTRYKSVNGSLYSKDGKTVYHLYDDGSSKFQIEEGTVLVKPLRMQGMFKELSLPNTLEPFGRTVNALNRVLSYFGKVNVPEKIDGLFYRVFGEDDLFEDDDFESYDRESNLDILEENTDDNESKVNKKKTAVEKCNEYKSKSLMLNFIHLEFEVDKEMDYVKVVDIIEPKAYTKKGNPVVVIPEFVSEFSLNYNGKWKDFQNIKISIPKGCSISTAMCRYMIDYTYEINIAKDHEKYSSEDGVLFNKNKTKLIGYPSYKIIEEYRIPNSVIRIEKDAFWRYKSSKLFISKNVIQIEGIDSYLPIFDCKTKIEVDPENTRYKSVNGSLYSKDGKIVYHLYDDGSGEVNIEEGTIFVSFCGKIENLEELYLPDSLKVNDKLEELLKKAEWETCIKVSERLKSFMAKYEDKCRIIYY